MKKSILIGIIGFCVGTLGSILGLRAIYLVFLGLIYIVISTILSIIREKKVFKNHEIKMAEEKEIVYSGLANHFLGMNTIHGWLVLTSEDLIFITENNGCNETNINLDDIITIKPTLTWGLIPNSILVETKNNKKSQFVVRRRKKWLTIISETRSFYLK